PKILQTHPGDTVTWTMTDAYKCQNEAYVSGALFLNDVSYWRIQGFTFANVANYRTISIEDSTNRATPVVGIEILDNTFVNDGNNGISTVPGYGGLDCDGGTTAGCPSYVLKMQAGPGGQTGSPVNIIARNKFIDCYGIEIGGGGGPGMTNTLVQGNSSTGNKG